MSSKANQKIKRKQYALMALVLVGLFGIAGVTGVMLDKSKAAGKATVEKPTTKPLSVGISQADRDATQMMATGDIAALRKMFDESNVANEQRTRELQEQLKALQAEKLQSIGSVRPPGANIPYDPNGTPFQVTGSPQAPEPRQAGPLGASPTAKAETQTSMLDSVSISPASLKPGDSLAGNVSDALVMSSNEFGRKQRELRDGGGPGRYDRTGDDDPLSPNRGSGRSADTYIPAGTFIRGVVLHGLDAPTGGQAQQNPHPVLIKLADDAFLPNKFRSRLKDCMITANGYGDIAAERAYIRTDRLSCIDEDGGAVDVALRGYIAGEDGKTGMRGRVVEKTGRILANAMLAAIGSGIGSAFKAQGTATSSNLLGGTTETITDGFKAGFGGGVNRAFDKLSDYYIKVAERMFPIVEINGGRVVDIVVSRGVSIERGNKPATNQ